MKEKTFYLLTILLFVTIALTACSSSETPTEIIEPQPVTPTELPAEEPSETISEEMTIYIGPILADCEGEGPQKCMLVKESPDEKYTYFYDQIEGFEVEDGF